MVLREAGINLEIKRHPRILEHMQYQAEGLGHFPILTGKAKNLITWGKNSGNMSSVVGPDKEHAIERTKHAMREAGMVSLDRTMRIVPNKPAESQILEVTTGMFGARKGSDTPDLITHANFIYTTDPTLALSVKPADCTISLIHATLPDGKPVLGLLHGGYKQVDALLPQQAIATLVSLGCKPEDITIGVSPSIMNYFMTNDTLGNLSNQKMWENLGMFREDTERQVTYLNILGFLLKQYESIGIPADNIEVYAIDTQKEAAKEIPETFSHAHAFYSNDLNKDGRFLVAAQLDVPTT